MVESQPFRGRTISVDDEVRPARESDPQLSAYKESVQISVVFENFLTRSEAL